MRRWMVWCGRGGSLTMHAWVGGCCADGTEAVPEAEVEGGRGCGCGYLYVSLWQTSGGVIER